MDIQNILSVLPCKLYVYLLLELHEHGGQHAELGAAARHLQQGQHHVLLVLLADQVLCLEHDDLHDLQVAAEFDEVVHVVSRKPRRKKICYYLNKN
mgnify:CR=1 FL=1